MLDLVEANTKHVSLARELFIEYANLLPFDLSFQGFSEEVQTLPGVYSSPRGSILLAFKNSELAGCVALKPIDQNVSEMKRLYVRPKFQGSGIGRLLATAILKKAKAIGYQKIRLDTVPSMTAAIQMYQSLGFYSIAPYRENPVPGTSYLEKNLSAD